MEKVGIRQVRRTLVWSYFNIYPSSARSSRPIHWRTFPRIQSTSNNSHLKSTPQPLPLSTRLRRDQSSASDSSLTSPSSSISSAAMGNFCSPYGLTLMQSYIGWVWESVVNTHFTNLNLQIQFLKFLRDCVRGIGTVIGPLSLLASIFLPPKFDDRYSFSLHREYANVIHISKLCPLALIPPCLAQLVVHHSLPWHHNSNSK